MNTVESQLSNLWLSSVLFYPTYHVYQNTVLRLSAFILHLFYHRSTQNGINYTPHHVYVSYQF